MSDPAVNVPAQAVGQTVERPTFTFAPDLVTLTDPGGESAETIRAIRTHVIAQHLQAGRRALAIAAPAEGAGCTFLATNLAVALAQVGHNVLLVDADLRQPGVDALIRPSQPVDGLVGCLSNPDTHIGEFVSTEVLPNLSVLFAGKATAHASELITHEDFAHVIDSCLRDYDVTIIDTPPANTSADARRICSVAGYALVVARRHRNLVPDVKTLCRQLAADHAVVLGTVMNA